MILILFLIYIICINSIYNILKKKKLLLHKGNILFHVKIIVTNSILSLIV